MSGEQNASRWYMDEHFLTLLHINVYFENVYQKKIEGHQIYDFINILT